MADSNDKKSSSPLTGWPSPSDRTLGSGKLGEKSTASDAGPVYDDPLAELDRIVNQDLQPAAPAGQADAVSSEELRGLEDDLLRELRGQMGDRSPYAGREAPTQPPLQTPSAGAGPRPHPADRPHPLSPPVSAQERQVPEAPRAGAAPTVAAPAATMPSSDTPKAAATEAPSLDNWSDLFGDKGAGPAPREPAASAPMPQAPAASAPSPQAPGHDDRMPTSGGFGQLSRSAAPAPNAPEARPYSDQGRADPFGADYPQAEQPAQATPPQAGHSPSGYRDPMGGFRPGEAGQMPSGRPSQAAAPAQPAAPAVSAGWSEQVALNDPAGSATPPSSLASEPLRHPSEIGGGGQPLEPTSSQEHYGVQPQMDPAQVDPYAQGHYEQGQYDQAQYGQGQHDQGQYDQGQYDQTQYDQTHYQQGHHDQGHYQDGQYYQGQPGYDPAYQQGDFSDPAVAQAALESQPYHQDEDYPTLDPEMAAAATAEPRKSRKGLITAMAAVAAIGVGGLLAWGYGLSGGGDSTETPVIAAQTDPVKEAPEDPGGKVIPHQNKTVYNRIDGSESDEGPSNLMPATEAPLAVTPEGDSPRVISLSGGEASVQQSGEQSGAAAPKKVRTVVVRPDGTIVTSNASDPAQPNVIEQAGLGSTPSEQALEQTFNSGINDPASSNGTAGAGAANAGLSSNVIDLTEGASLSAGSDPSSGLLPKGKPSELVALQATQNAASQPVAPAPAQPAAPARIVTNTQPQTGQQPISLIPPGNNQVAASIATAPAVNNVAGGAFTVQVTSQRTPEQAQASYNSIQAQLSSVLGGYQPDIKQADLGDRGIYYRVRVGSFADRNSANAFCNSIKAAGGDCLVAAK